MGTVLLRRFHGGARRASPVAVRVLVDVPLLTPRREDRALADLLRSCCLRTCPIRSAPGSTVSGLPSHSLALRPADSLAAQGGVRQWASVSSVSLPSAIQATGLRPPTPAGLLFLLNALAYAGHAGHPVYIASGTMPSQAAAPAPVSGAFTKKHAATRLTPLQHSASEDTVPTCRSSGRQESYRCSHPRLDARTRPCRASPLRAVGTREGDCGHLQQLFPGHRSLLPFEDLSYAPYRLRSLPGCAEATL